MNKILILVARIAIVSTLISACASKPSREIVRDLNHHDVNAAIEKKITVTTPDVKMGMQVFLEGNYLEASRHFSRALKFDPRSSSIHFLNALCFHMLAEQGDSSQTELAEIGYRMAMELDPSNPYPTAFMGYLNMSQQKYPEARDLFARALQVDKNRPDLLLALARSSYYAKDLETANAAIQQAVKVDPDNAQILSAAAMIHAANGNFELSEKTLQRLGKMPKADASRIQYLTSRLEDWRSTYKGAIRKVATKHQDTEDDNDTEDLPAPPPPTPAASMPMVNDGKVPRMVTIDVVMIRSDEINRTNKGVNLLNGLQLQYSASNVTTKNSTEVFDPDTSNSPVNTFSRALTSSISVPAVNYNLNIFNDNDARHEILARPTLISMDGRPSTFFSGATLNVAIDGNSGSSGSIQPIPIGVNLTVTPQFIDDETIKLEVSAGREFVEEPNVNASFSKFVQTSKNTVAVNVVMKFEETLIVSGMSEKESSTVRDGVPLLKSIPLVQYFFSNEKTLDYTRSVLILLTPQRPRFVNKKSAGSGERSPEIKSLMKKVDWFAPASTTDTVLTKLGSNEYYTDFRSGDIETSAWSHNGTLKNSIQHALRFLYY